MKLQIANSGLLSQLELPPIAQSIVEENLWRGLALVLWCGENIFRLRDLQLTLRLIGLLYFNHKAMKDYV